MADRLLDNAKDIFRHVGERIDAPFCVELWDGSAGTRGDFKYSRNTKDLFEGQGLHTLHWQPSVGQYDTTQSRLWSYVGSREAETLTVPL